MDRLILCHYKYENTFGMASAGAILKSIGAQAASANAIIFANGFTPNSFAFAAVINTTAAPPSFNVEALPAVTVPSINQFVLKCEHEM
jgi:hypothetical protein